MEKIMFSLLISWGLTVILEGAAGFLFFGIRSRKDQCFLFLVNTLTNPIAVLACILISRYTSFSLTAAKLTAELLIFAGEGFLFRAGIKEDTSPWKMALILNLISFCAGLLLDLMIY